MRLTTIEKKIKNNIEKFITNSIDWVEDSEKEKERMIEHIKNSVKGLQSLQKTYENDITMKARIDCLIDDVNKILT